MVARGLFPVGLGGRRAPPPPAAVFSRSNEKQIERGLKYLFFLYFIRSENLHLVSALHREFFSMWGWFNY